MSKVRIACCVPLYGDSEAAGVSRSFLGDLTFMSQVNLAAALGGGPLGLGVICDETGWDSGDVELDPTPYPKAIEHARTQLVKLFLEHPRAYTHLWFRDVDNKAATPRVCAQLVGRMLKADKPLIGVACVQKSFHPKAAGERIREALDRDPSLSAERLADLVRGFAVRYVPDPAAYGGRLPEPDEHGLIPFDEPNLAFALIKREVLEKMVAYYADDPRLRYEWRRNATPDRPGETTSHVGLFHTTIEHGAFRAEDQAFCQRWKAIGGRAFLYVGEGAPLEHIGYTSFKGTREGLMADWAGR